MFRNVEIQQEKNSPTSLTVCLYGHIGSRFLTGSHGNAIQSQYLLRHHASKVFKTKFSNLHFSKFG